MTNSFQSNFQPTQTPNLSFDSGQNFNNQSKQNNQFQQNQFTISQPMQQFQTQSMQQYFPQPQGNVYMINSANEVGNIPVTNGLSVAVCLQENILFIKTFQNGAVAVATYNILPFENQKNINNTTSAAENSSIEIDKALSDFSSRLEKVENYLKIKASEDTKNGGKVLWEI